MLDGVRVTRTLSLRPATLMGTAGHGLFLDEKGGLAAHPIASSNEICGNHAMAFARFAGHLVIATFDEGLCLRDGDRFMKIDALPFRMVNDLAVFRGSLFVAANEGLFRSQDGVKFERVVLGDETLDGGNRGFNRLALDGGRLWATTPGALVRIGARRVNITWAPGGSTALQAVSVAGGHVWLASEDRGVMRREADGRFTLFDRAAGLPSSWMVDVAATPDGGALAATLRHGLVRIHADGQFEPISGLPDAWMLRVSPAKRGGFYVGTQGGAAFLDNRGGVTRIPLTAGPCVHAFFEDGGHLWVGTESGTTLHQN
jgi:ligand-binding sensor domain-containing protein